MQADATAETPEGSQPLSTGQGADPSPASPSWITPKDHFISPGYSELPN